MDAFSRVAACALAMCFLLSACQKNDDPNPTNQQDELDAELLSLLELNGGEQGSDYFLLPASGDYDRIPQDPNNPLTQAKIELGKMLFHETGIARNPRLFTSENQFSCASCHHSSAGFQAGIAQGIGEGGFGFGFKGEGRTIDPEYFNDPIWKDSIDVQHVRSPSILNIAYQKNVLWNGQFGATDQNEGTEYAWTEGTPKFFNHLGFEGTETQAIAGQTVHRLLVDHEFCEEYSEYMNLFAQAFGNVPNSIEELRINSGLAIAAYERTVLANEAPFQHWLKGNRNMLSNEEKRGAILFFGKANCVSCHTGPALNSMEFHAYGMNDLHLIPDVFGANENSIENLGRGGFTGDSEDNYKFKVPQLYNLRDVEHLGHGASFGSLAEVVEYKNQGVPENMNVPQNQLAEEFEPLMLTKQEVQDLVAFLENSLYDQNLDRYTPQELPTGMCFPNADPQSMIDQGCAE